jgi:uncharacterized membrane protein
MKAYRGSRRIAPLILNLSTVLFLVMEHRWNEIDRGKPKYSEKNLSQ